jgi:hypothetical protein
MNTWRVLCILGCLSLAVPSQALSFQKHTPKDTNHWLRAIYNEVKELGFREHEDFLKREFHFNLDGKWANREEHIVVLSHPERNGEKMILQVTYFGEGSGSSHARYPATIREITCLIEGDAIEIMECGFGEEETRDLLPEILKGIQNEKKLLELIKHKR